MTLRFIMLEERKVPLLSLSMSKSILLLGQCTAVDIYICAGQLKMRGSGSGVALLVAGGKQLALCLHSGTAHVPSTHVHH